MTAENSRGIRPEEEGATIRAAIQYLKRGWAVLPLWPIKDSHCTCEQGEKCGKPGKHPLIAWKCFQERLPTEEEVRGWWRRWPDAGICVVTGAVSGLVALDADGAAGRATLENKLLPPSPTVLTGGGGEHRYFANPGFCCKNFVRGQPGLDFRGDGGYVVVPPTLHASGQRYKWAEGFAPEDVDLAPCPTWLIDLLTEQDRAGKSKTEAVADRIPEGCRNDCLASLAGTMRRRGMSTEAIDAALQEENAVSCNPPLSAEEVSGIAISVGQYAPATETRSRTAARDGGEAKGLPRIDAGNQHLPTVTREAWGALEAANRPERFFLHHGVPCRIESVALDSTVGGAETLAPRELTVDKFRHELARVSYWFVEKQENSETIELPAKPPLDVVKDCLATPNPPLPLLHRISEVPTFARTGGF